MPADALLRMGIGLLIVVGLILGGAWVMRRAGLGPLRQHRHLREVEALRMGPRHKISLIELDGTWLVVGVSAGQMTLLHSQAAPTSSPLPAGEDTGTPTDAPRKPSARTAQTFADLLSRARGQG
ncbi:MAG: flagellar biosynthetic protein FliO [Burkholderiaceae bacterium]|nr:flagellar biosynthetic protein FliO [Burkholderiaceae bacterium]